MEGWADLLKHFLTSRLSSASMFVTSAVFTLGPRHLDFVPALPEGWQWVPFAAMVFTGVQCTWWGLSSLLRGSIKLIPKRRPPGLTPRSLTDDEKMLLAVVAKKGPMQVEHLARWGAFSDPFAPSVCAKSLAEKRLLDRGFGMSAGPTTEGKAFVMRFRSDLPQI